ncbi:MAG TPA: carboxylating nicotinate-nucleotide diphosphorylase [Fimbriimonadaceae bacterium]|jgi:nicotinate-nucleotide pyrophosphorylase (carboxylating)
MGAWLQPEPSDWWSIVDDAIVEDVGPGDITSGCIDSNLLVDWYIEAQEDGVLCGAGIAEYMLTPYGSDPEEAKLIVHKVDSDRIQRGDRILEGTLPARRVMMAERTALNFLMHLSGVATITDTFVQKVEGTNARIIDTRKTIPGLRALQKYAVRCGGGSNHRLGLFDGALIKDNHINAVGSIREAVEAIRSYASHLTKIEVECESLEMVDEAVKAGAEVILLDNMDPFMMRDAVRKYEGKALFEASGGISLDTVRGVAQTGVDFISIGLITHSAPAVNFHMEIS